MHLHTHTYAFSAGGTFSLSLVVFDHDVTVYPSASLALIYYISFVPKICCAICCFLFFFLFNILGCKPAVDIDLLNMILCLMSFFILTNKFVDL